jgi:ergothioneine biosynthesis protein EgtB
MAATLISVAVETTLLERLQDARRRTDELFAIVKPESIYERPIPERHRIIFYIGHLEAFDWNLLSERNFGLKPFQPELDRLFAFGIDPVGGGLPDDKPSDWPRLDEVHGYASRIRQVLDDKVANASTSEVRGEFPLSQLLNVAIEHRLMHAETLAYMLHQLPFTHKVIPSAPSIQSNEPVAQQMIQIPAGRATLGLARDDENFGWDNEYEVCSVDVPAFAIDKFEVTNGQFLAFLRAGGYEMKSFWTEDDWKWKTENGISHPVFWKRNNDQWLYCGMFEEQQPLPLNAPVYVSLAEARAYAAWAGKDLPTEAEWHRAAYGDTDGGERAYPWGDAAPNGLGNFDFANWNPTPVNAFPAGESAFGVADLLGNGWEWTSTQFAPLPEFKAFPFYPGYSADFFDGKHFVIKGGSPRTAACMLRRSFRNWFQPHYQYVYAGFRCVKR